MPVNITLKDGKTNRVELTEKGIEVYLREGNHFSLRNPHRRKFRMMDNRKKKGNIITVETRSGKLIPIPITEILKGVLNE
jgi:hypothetical protein